MQEPLDEELKRLNADSAEQASKGARANLGVCPALLSGRAALVLASCSLAAV